jgi:hypothetical protein
MKPDEPRMNADEREAIKASAGHPVWRDDGLH